MEEKIVVGKMAFYETSVDKMSINKMSVDKILVYKISC